MSLWLLWHEYSWRYKELYESTFPLTLWPSYLTFDLQKLITDGGYRVTCMYQILGRLVKAFVRYRVYNIGVHSSNSKANSGWGFYTWGGSTTIKSNVCRALNIWARGTYDISFEPAKCVHSYCSMSSQLYCVFNGETAPSGGRPAEQIWVKYVVFHSRNSVLFNMVWSNIV